MTSSTLLHETKPTDSEKAKVRIRLDLKGELAEKFIALKKSFGLTTNAQLVRLLVTIAYNEMTSEKPGFGEVFHR